MRTVVQEWIDLQNEAILPESDIWFYFYNTSTGAFDIIINRNDIKNFKYRQSGSILNKIFPKKEIVFEQFTYCRNDYQFSLNQLCCVVFKYKSVANPNQWLSMVVGNFRVASREKIQNGLLTRYTLDNSFCSTYTYGNNARPKIFFDDFYDKGSNREGEGDDNRDVGITSLVRKILSYEYTATGSTGFTSGCGKSLPITSIIDSLQMCACAIGKTLYVGATVNSMAKANNKVSFRNINSENVSGDYIVRDYICFTKPEIIEEEKVSSCTINVYVNKKGGYYWDSQEVSYVGCESFVIDCDEPQDWTDYGYGEGYVGYQKIDPSKFWYNYVDKTGDSWCFLIDNELVAFSEERGIDGFTFPYMETTYDQYTYSVSSIGGSNITIDNLLINSNYRDYAKTLLTTFLPLNNSLKVEGRFDPRLELFDKIQVRFEDKKYVICVEDFTITYNGGFRGEIIGKILDYGEELVIYNPKTEFAYSENFSFGGTAKIKTFYGEEITIPESSLTFSGFNNTQFGKQTITVSTTYQTYGTFSATYEIEVVKPTSYIAFAHSHSGNLNSITLESEGRSWSGVMLYSLGTGNIWNLWDGTPIIDRRGRGIKIAGYGNTKISYSSSFSRLKITSNTNDIKISGNIESILDYYAAGKGNLPNIANFAFARLFFNNATIMEARNLSLPRTTLVESIYEGLFQECSNLKTAPTLPATGLATACYKGMFKECSSLQDAPTLPATNLARYCYCEMFSGCSSLISVPDNYLPATVVKDACYMGMFQNSGLVKAPNLPATNINGMYCYISMFEGCGNIKLSSTQTGLYTLPYRIPTSGTGSAASATMEDMFTDTGGTFAGTPSVNTTYYQFGWKITLRSGEQVELGIGRREGEISLIYAISSGNEGIGYYYRNNTMILESNSCWFGYPTITGIQENDILHIYKFPAGEDYMTHGYIENNIQEYRLCDLIYVNGQWIILNDYTSSPTPH